MMIKSEIDAEQSTKISTKLADEAWKQLGEQPMAALTLKNIAQRVGVDMTLAKALAGDPQQLLMRKIAALDDQSLLETFADIEDAGEISTREKILEALMHRFEVYAPYRAQVRALSQAARRRPDLGIALGIGLQNVIRRILAMAGDGSEDWRGLMRIKGVVAVVMAVVRVWMKDDSPDLAPTMNLLDRRLQQAEEWAINLRLFPQSEKKQADNYPHDV